MSTGASPAAAVVRVVVADDQELVRSGFAMIVDAQPDLEVVGEAADGEEAVRLARRERADVVLMDIRMPGLERLTPREREVLGLIGQGRNNAEIGAELFVGEATVKTHVGRVLMKLGLRDRVHAVIYAYEAGLAGQTQG